MPSTENVTNLSNSSLSNSVLTLGIWKQLFSKRQLFGRKERKSTYFVLMVYMELSEKVKQSTFS